MSRDTRDWQKDMELCSAATDGLDMVQGETQVFTQFAVEDINVADFIKEEDAIFFIESREALPYWLQQYANMKVSKQIYRKVAQKYSMKYRAEKERTDRIESELELAYDEVERMQKEYARLDETAANDYDKLVAEKERADKAEASGKEWMCAYWSLHGKYKAVEEREQKLKEAYEKLESIFCDCGTWVEVNTDDYSRVLDDANETTYREAKEIYSSLQTLDKEEDK
ncbi:hypothetical protein D3C74_264560 [compost metagenome]